MRAAHAIVVLTLLSTGQLAPDVHGQQGDRAPHRSEFVQVNGIRLNYLDWGGSGPTLVLVHGIFDNPHVLDDLAERLRGRFRVVAYARRGHGDSDAPDGPYDVATLTEDLRQLLDRLGIRRASLLGWSMGGNEITRFAGLYPERVERLVYLDAAYDWAEPVFHTSFVPLLLGTVPTAADLASLDAYRAWYRREWFGREAPWSDGLDAYLRNTVRMRPDGILENRTSDAVGEALIQSLANAPRDYTRVRAPALALYTAPFFPEELGDAERTRTASRWERDVMSPFRAASVSRVRAELRDVQVRMLSGRTHMSIGGEKLDELAGYIVPFLRGELPPE